MAVKGNSSIFTGVRGFITEFTETNFPQDALYDVLNCDVELDGSVTTRPGIIEQEASTNLNTSDIKENVVTAMRESFTWYDVSGRANLNFEVVRVGLYLYIMVHSNTLIGTHFLTVSLADQPGLIVNASLAMTAPSRAVSGNGYMFWANAGMNPFYLTYDEEADDVTFTVLTIRIRDIDGIDEGIADDARPTTLTSAHEYNLLNQGWPSSARTCVTNQAGSSVDTLDPIRHTADKLGYYPSNSDVYYYAKATQAEKAEAIDAFSPWVLDNSLTGNTPAPKGNVILEAFNQRRATISRTVKVTQEATVVDADTEEETIVKVVVDEFIAGTTVSTKVYESRPSVVAFYSGRTFWGGVDETGLVNNIYFSQVTSNPDKAGNCYQSASPTAEEINDLIDTDGGVIPVQGMANLYGMQVMGTYLILLAANGIWAVSGSEGSSFSATNVSIQKISDVGCVSRKASCVMDSRVYYLADSSINVVTLDETGFNLVVQDMTESTIKSFYRTIRPEAIVNAMLYAVPKEKKVYMLYNGDDELDTIDYRDMLIFKQSNATFTKYQLGSKPTIRLFSMLSIRDTSRIISEDIVYDDQGVAVTENDDNTLVTVAGTALVDREATEKAKFLAIVDNGDGVACNIIAAHFTSDTYTDWVGRGAVGYDNYFELGFDPMGGNPLTGTPIYVNSYFARDMTPQPSQFNVTTEHVRIFQAYVQVLEKL